MEELRVRAGNEELKARGSLELIQGEREAFYQHIKEMAEVSAMADARLVQAMQDSMIRCSRVMQEKVTVNFGKNGVLRICGELQATWEEIAAAIKSGIEFKVGDYKSGIMEDGQRFTMVVTDVANDYVRFESRDCVGREVEWNKEDRTKGGYPGSDIHKYLNNELFKQLPEDLRKVISLTERKTLRDGETETFNTYLFLPTASEVFDDGDCYGDDGVYEQMEYYKDRRHRMKGAAEGEDMCYWWLASVGSGASAYACFVYSDGYAGYWHASAAPRVPVCFTIKKS